MDVWVSWVKAIDSVRVGPYAVWQIVFISFLISQAVARFVRSAEPLTDPTNDFEKGHSVGTKTGRWTRVVLEVGTYLSLLLGNVGSKVLATILVTIIGLLSAYKLAIGIATNIIRDGVPVSRAEEFGAAGGAIYAVILLNLAIPLIWLIRID